MKEEEKEERKSVRSGSQPPLSEQHQPSLSRSTKTRDAAAQQCLFVEVTHILHCELKCEFQLVIQLLQRDGQSILRHPETHKNYEAYMGLNIYKAEKNKQFVENQVCFDISADELLLREPFVSIGLY